MLLGRAVSRSALVLAKWLASTVTLVVGLVLAGPLCWACRALLFEPLPLGAFALLNLLLRVSDHESSPINASRNHSSSAVLLFFAHPRGAWLFSQQQP